MLTRVAFLTRMSVSNTKDVPEEFITFSLSVYSIYLKEMLLPKYKNKLVGPKVWSWYQREYLEMCRQIYSTIYV